MPIQTIIPQRKLNQIVDPFPAGLTFLKSYKRQKTLNADHALGSPVATFTASRSATNPATKIETQVGNSLLFSGVDIGTDEDVGISADESIQIFGSTAYSVTATINAQSGGAGGGGRILANTGDVTIDIRCIGVSGNTCELTAKVDFGVGTDAVATTTGAVIKFGTKHNIAFVFNEDSDNKIKLYVDGVLASLSTDTAGVGTIDDDSSDSKIIGNLSAGDRTFGGQIFDMAIYRNKALSASEVLSIHNGGAKTGATAHWDMSDGSGSTLTDIVGSNDGTFGPLPPRWLTNGSTYITQVTASDTSRFTTGFYSSTGFTSAPGLLIEGARTNLLSNAYEFNNANWSKSNVTIATDSVDGPSNISNSQADTLTASAANGTVLQAETIAVNTFTFSIFLKRLTGTGNIDLTVDGGATWTTVTVTAGWTRHTLTQASVTNPSSGVRIVTDTDAVYAWGAQLEQAAYPSSFIPTTTAALTRNAELLKYEIASNRTAEIETLIYKFRPVGDFSADGVVRQLDATDTKNRRIEKQANDNYFRFYPNVSDSSGSRTTATGTIPLGGTSYVLASIAYGSSAGTNSQMYYGGINAGTNTTNYIAPVWGTYFYIGSAVNGTLNANIILESASFFNKALSAAEVATATTILNQ
jgi:hypothetical protein